MTKYLGIKSYSSTLDVVLLVWFPEAVSHWNKELQLIAKGVLGDDGNVALARAWGKCGHTSHEFSKEKEWWKAPGGIVFHTF